MGNKAISSRPRRRWWLLALGVSAVVASSFAGLKLADHQRSPKVAAARGWHGKVAKLVHGGADSAGGLTAQAPGAASVVLAQGAEILPGTRLVTDGKTQARIELDDGTALVLDRASELTFGADARGLTVKEGTFVADFAEVAGAPECIIETPSGIVRTAGAKIALTAIDDRTSVEVLRGEVQLEDKTRATVRVGAGEEGIASRAARIEVAAASDLGQRVAFGGELSGGPHN